jgi:hypothetical protein
MRKLSDFIGRWRIERRIEDRHMAGTGLFEGAALFVADGQGLAYEEAGELRLPAGAGMKSTRRYLWRQDAPEAIDVLFEDGSDFHRIETGREVVTAWHDCMPDTYEVSYNFSRFRDETPSWRAIWQVTGPRKDYTMITDYSKA